MPNSSRSRSTCADVRPEYENMPRWVVTKEKSCLTPRAFSFSTSCTRIWRMRSRMPASSCSQSLRSSGVDSTAATIAAPWVGGFE